MSTSKLTTGRWRTGGCMIASSGTSSRHRRERERHVVPATERGLDEAEAVEIEDILAPLDSGQVEAEGEVERHADVGDEAGPQSSSSSGGVGGGSIGVGMQVISEMSCSGMFALDGVPDAVDVEKVRFACEAVEANNVGSDN